jgi:hypothetical protein
MSAMAEEAALTTVCRPEEAAGRSRTGESGTATGMLSKRDSNFMLEQGNVALARLPAATYPYDWSLASTFSKTSPQ